MRYRRGGVYLSAALSYPFRANFITNLFINKITFIMKKKSLLLMLLLMAILAPWAAKGQTRGTNTLLSENFDDMSSINTSYSATDWFAYKASGENNWSLNTSSTYAHSGSKSAQYSYTDNTDANCYLVSAPFNATMATLYVSLYERVRSGSYPEEFEVFLVKASDVAAAEDVVSATHYAAIASASYTNTTYSEITGSVTDNELAGQSLRIVVRCTSESGMWNLYIDDIVVTEPTTDPYIDLDPTSATVFTGFTQDLTASYGNVTGTPTITYTTSNNKVATVSGSGTVATVTAVAPGTCTITATMTYNATDYTATCDVTVEDPHYCTPSFSYTGTNYGLYIAGFSTTGGEIDINNTSSLSTGGYGDYYSTNSVSAGFGQSIGFTVTPGGTANEMIYAMWIDWNQDYDFDDAGELVAQQSTGITTNWTGTINIPATTPLGDYRIRIESGYKTETLSPCVSGTYGETEDYKLTVITPASCSKPSALAIVGTIGAKTVTLGWTAQGSETEWQICLNGDETNLIEVSENPYPLTNLTPETIYTAKVRAKCSDTDQSLWSNDITFTTNASCIAPTAVTVSDITATTATVSWNSASNSDLRYVDNPNYVFQGFVTDPHAMSDGSNASWLHGSSTTWGTNVNYSGGYRIADDFTVYSTTTLTEIEVYAYQTGSTTISTFTGLYAQIYDGDPSNGGNVVWGDMSTNIMTSTSFTNCYRCSNNESTVMNRPIMAITANGLDINLNAGTYWLVFGLTGTMSSGPWFIPQSDPTNGNIGNGLQCNSGTWSALNDNGSGAYGPSMKLTFNDIESFNWTEVNNITANEYTLPTLTPETAYLVQVRSNCGGDDGNSAWISAYFTTAPSCFVPTGLAVSEITNHSAKFSWTGTSDSYIVKVGEVITTTLKSYDFEDNAISTDFTNSTTYPWTATAGGYNSSSYCATPGNKGENSSTSDLTLDLTLTENATISFYAKISSESSDYGRFLIDGSQKMSISGTSSYTTWKKYEYDLTAGTHTLIWRYYKDSSVHSGDDCFYVDNIVITKKSVASWMTYNAASSPFTVNDPVNIHPETNYAVKVQGNCGSEGLSQESAPVFFTTDIACPAPTGLTASNPKSSSFDLQWTNGGSEDWIVAYKKTTDADFSENNLNESDVTVEGNLITYTLGGLEAETDYIVKVRDNCEASYTGDGVSEWTAEVPYSTIAACAAMNPVVSNITHYTAKVDWEGESATGFTVNYRVAAGDNVLFEEGFENGLGSWTFTSMNAVNGIGGSGTNPAGIQSAAAHSDSYGFRFSSYTKKANEETYDQYLVSPELTVTGTLKFYAWRYGDNDKIYVGYSTTTSDLDAFTWDEESLAFESNSSWKEFTHELPDNVKYIAYHYFGDYAYYAYVDDIAITVPTPAGAWQTELAATTTANLSGLTAGTKYDLKVVPNCDETLESATVQFTTVSPNNKWFIAAGDWGTAANWEPTGAPTIDQTVTLYANVTIESDCVAEAKSITQGTHTITIEDGGQLKHDNTGVTATVKKSITGYGAENTNTKLGYYLISNPLNQTINKHTSASTPNISSTGLLTGTYDFYNWNNQKQGAEWRNYEATGATSDGPFDMFYSMYSYLYANENDVDLTFTGTVRASNSSVNRYLTNNSSSYTFGAWYLLGNPFVCDAYLVNASTSGTALPYYRMNAAEGKFEAVTSGPIAPMEGVFYEATTSGSVYMVRTAPAPVTSIGNGNLNINLAQNVNSRDAVAETDNAIVRFDGGQQLSKFSFRENSAKVYIPQDNKDYAVVSAEANGVLPVNVKVATTGNYTISFSNDDIEFAYLHLIDRFTGEDIDLLIDPEYTFIASPRDKENRFNLVFNSFDSNIDIESDIFAYQSGDEIIVSGEGTLQVFDVMGRFMGNYNVNGNTRISASQFSNAVYIFILVGDDVKTQKIVVR